MFREILPNCLGPLVVDGCLRIGYAAFAIGALGFLGLGLPPPDPDWGRMVAEGRVWMMTSPWSVLFPALAISSLVVGLNLFADGVNEASQRV
jgi:peptide/nickel transport system permease protein